MGNKTQEREPGYLRPGGLYWRSISALLVFQAIGWGCAAGLAYLVLSPELAKDYFSAHRTVKATWQLVVPALAIAAGAGFFVVGLGTALSVWSHSRSLLRPLRRLDGLLEELSQGRIPRAASGERATGVERRFDAALETLRERIGEFQRISRDLKKVSLELNYRAAGSTEVTLKDLRGLADKFDALSKELSHTCGRFEG
jgi:methyl-accepting chemotaxis protein